MIPQSFEADEAERVLAEFGQQLDTMNLEPALRDCLPVIHEGFETNFMEARGPSGAPWLPRKDSKPHPLLILTGALLEAARDTGGMGHIDRVGPRELETGVDGGTIEYAPVHEYGSSNIPARPYMYASDKVQDQIAETFLESAFTIIVGA